MIKGAIALYKPEQKLIVDISKYPILATPQPEPNTILIKLSHLLREVISPSWAPDWE